MSEDTQIENRLKSLETHLKEENDILFNVVQTFRDLDKIAYEMGILDEEQSYATHVSWWPMISILGTFSAGKSTFINYHLGHKIQRTGTQAVDDKFTVMCYSGDENVGTLPGVALDADPRFPFYQISRGIEEIVAAGGQRVDAYLQLKTCPSEQLRGKILIDSPGFDADSQRTATLRIVRYIIDLSDLVLVFFDARHPEPGAMHDTLEHLVAATIDRPDSNKFLYILNQIDVTAREDNPEEVVAAWQRSLAQAGLTAGRFYRIYNPEVCMPITDPKVKERYESKRDADMEEIRNRMNQVGTERAYRIIGVLEQAAKNIEQRLVPQLQELIGRWKSRVFIIDSIVLLLLVISGATWCSMTGATPTLPKDPTMLNVLIGMVVVVLAFLHIKIAGFVANSLLKKIQRDIHDEHNRDSLLRAFRKNTCAFRALFMPLISKPAGWSNSMRKRIYGILNEANSYIVKLNDRFTNPSGKKPVIKESAETTDTAQS